MTQRRLTMTRRVAFLFCCTVLVATSVHAGARRITPMDRFSDAVCEASPEAAALDPIQKALRDLAAALAASKLPPATLTFDDGGEIRPLSIYCRQPCYSRCEVRCTAVASDCMQPCDSRYSTCYHNCQTKACTDLCAAAHDACAAPCDSDFGICMNGCFDSCCFDY